MYTLIWSGRAVRQLADIYVTLPLEEQRRLAPAIEAFNQRVQNRPFDEGESRAGNVRITIFGGVVIRFRVSSSEQTVRVNSIHRYGR
jgi:hypothetical protein